MLLIAFEICIEAFLSVLRIRIRSDPVFLGHPDLNPDPDPVY